MMNRILRHAFIRNGTVTLHRDERGEVSHVVLAARQSCRLEQPICPYCEGTRNTCSMADTGLGLRVEAADNEPDHLEINGFRCQSCAKPWLMLVSGKGEGFALGVNWSQPGVRPIAAGKKEAAGLALRQNLGG